MADHPDTEPLDIDVLIEQCGSDDRLLQIQAMIALEEAGATKAIPTIFPLLGSKDEGVRSCAAEVLGKLGGECIEQVGPAIEALLSDPEVLVRNVAVAALGSLRYGPGRPALEHVLSYDDEWVVRASVAEALGDLGDARALQALEAALADESAPVRGYAASAIGQLGDESQLPVIRRRLAVEDHPMPRADLLEVALRWGDESAFDDFLALIRAAYDEEFAHDVLRVINHLFSERTPAVVLRRAAELDRHLAQLAQQTGIEADYPDQLRARLAALPQPIAADEE